LRIWDLVTGISRHILTGHTSWVSALVVAPDGSWLATADTGGEVRVWDPVTGTLRYRLTGHTVAVFALAVAPDGSWLASGDNRGELRIWDPSTGIAITSLRVAGSLNYLLATSTTIVATGERGVYFLTLCHNWRSE
jgi:WD40 repeat protein